jgi:hypothetical protein
MLFFETDYIMSELNGEMLLLGMCFESQHDGISGYGG